MTEDGNRRVLLIDDAPTIHDDFRKVLVPAQPGEELDHLEAALFGGESPPPRPMFELNCVHDGEQGLSAVLDSVRGERPFAVAFVDMVMPAGWDGVETIERLWEADPRLQVVICTAYAEYSWDRVLERLPVEERLLILKKPFDPVEVRQLAAALCARWTLSRRADRKLAELEELVRLRTVELETLNRELNRAKGQAQAATRVKSEFLANMSHEIRTPMTTVLGMTHLALQSGLAPRQQEYLGKARSAAESLMKIINDILDFSSLESGREELEPSEFWLPELVERVSSSISPKAQLKEIDFVLELPPAPLPSLVGDPRRLEQVLLNLCENAVKFSERGKVLLRVRAVSESAERLTLGFDVRDSGVGIPPRQMELLFAPFTPLDASSTRRNGGAGIGLAICRELVELMGGELGAVSEPGGGSEFSFSATFGRGQARRPKESAGRGAESLPELPGISVAAGIAYCCDNAGLYRDMLAKFLATRAGAAGEIEEELARGAWQSAARAAHTMTSVAATIGAKALSDAARDLESALKEHDPLQWAPQLARFRRQLGLVVGTLTAAFGSQIPSAAQAQEVGTIDRQWVKSMLDRMSALFDQDLDQALALKELLHRELKGSGLAREFGRMERLIETFDFEGALKARKGLDRLLETATER